MKKILLATLSIILLFGCTNKKPVEEPIIDGGNGGVWDMVEKQDVKELNELTGTHISKVDLEGISDEAYRIISGNLAEYDFILNGIKFNFRASKELMNDISGVHDENNIFVSGVDDYYDLTDYYLCRFFDGDTQYTIGCPKDESLTFDAFKEICEQYKAKTLDKNSGVIEGNYMDSYSQRASCTVSLLDDVYTIFVSWASSDSERTTWYMEATLEDNKLSYMGETISNYSCNEDGEEILDSSTASNNVGYFEIIDDKLYWKGAAQEDCQKCVFEKIPMN